MATRRFQFIMTVEEIWEALKLLAEEHHLQVYIRSLVGSDKQVHAWKPTNLPRTDLALPAKVYFAEHTQPINPEVLPDIPSPQAGVVVMLFDGAEGNRLYTNDLNARSDWSEAGESFENPSVLDLHRRLKATLKKQLKAGVIVSHVEGGVGRIHKDCHLSPGAIAFHAAGGELMQRGAENVRFAPLPEEASSASKPNRPPRDSARRKR